MMIFRSRPWGRVLFVTLATLSLATSVRAEVTFKAINYAPDEWVEPHQAIVFQLSHMADAGKGRLAFFIGSKDVTALMQPIAAGEYQYRASMVLLPAGEQEMKIYLVHDDNQWTELVTTPLRVLTSGGFEESEIEPRVDIAAQAQ